MLRYTPLIEELSQKMTVDAGLLQSKMDELKTAVAGLVGESQGTATTALTEVERLWQQSGLAHNESLGGVATAANNAYTDIVAADNRWGNALYGI